MGQELNMRVVGRVHKLQNDVDKMASEDAMKKSLVHEYVTIGESCSSALAQIIIRNEYPDVDMETIRLARTIIDGYGNILKIENGL